MLDFVCWAILLALLVHCLVASNHPTRQDSGNVSKADSEALLASKRANHRARLRTAAIFVPFFAVAMTTQPLIAVIYVIALIPRAIQEYIEIVFTEPSSTSSTSSSTSSTALGSRSQKIFDFGLSAVGLLIGVGGLLPSYEAFSCLFALSFVLVISLYFTFVISIPPNGANTASSEAKKQDDFSRMAKYVFGLFWIPWTLSHAVRLIHIHGQGGLVLLLLLTSWLGDAAGYYVGSRFGRIKVMAAVSPNKTLEGTLAVVAFSVVMTAGAALARPLLPSAVFPDFSLFHYLALGLLIGVFGVIGDALESFVKRVGDVKDSGTFFPGHGGILDRFDSFLICTPIVFFYYWSFLL